MRLLHTSDWHAGRTIHRRQRLDETEAVLKEIVGIAEAEEVDVALVCGDIYESFAPSAEAERIVYDALLGLSKLGIPVLILAGNHDYARRLGAVEALLQAVDVHACPSVRRPDAGGIINLKARSDGSEIQVAALPWVAERMLFGAEEMMGLQGEPYQVYAERLGELIKALCTFDADKVHILAAHLFVSGAKPGGGERELTMGEIFAVNGASLPTSPQYIALGHVHRPQVAPGSGLARYSGSPLQLDFGEAGQEKSVTIVDVEPGKPAKPRQVKLTSGRQLLDIETSLDALDSVDVDPEAYLRVFLACDGPSPGLVDRVRDVLPNAVEVRLVYERDDPEKRAAELKRMSPEQLFDRYYHRQHGADPDKGLTKLFSELYEEVANAPATD